MRRLAVTALGFALAACSTPAVVLTPRFRAGDTRTYRLTSDATTTLDVPGLRRAERTELVARSEITTVSVAGDETTVRLTLTPERLTRDGSRQEPPGRQQAELVLGPDGAVRRIVSVGGLPAEEAGTDVEDLAPVLGSPLPLGRHRLGDRWRRTLPPLRPGETATGVQHGRVGGLRVVRGFDCAVVVLGTRRPIARARALEQQTVGLAGTEHSTTEMAFAFRRGFAVEIRTESVADLSVSQPTPGGGSVSIRSDTRLVLLDPRA